MHRQLFNILLALVLAGCGGAPSIKSGKSDRADRAPVELEVPVARPVIQADRGGEELLAAIALLKEGNFRQGEANLEEIVKVRPDLAEAHFNLGWARMKLKKCDGALTAWDAGLKLRPAEVGVINLRAICQRMLGRFTDAEMTYRQALAIAPENDKLHLNLGVLYELYLFRPDLALEHYRRFQSLQKSPDPKVAGWIVLLERKDAK